MTKFTSQYDDLEREYHPAVMPGWLPIELAPLDGTPIIISAGIPTSTSRGSQEWVVARYEWDVCAWHTIRSNESFRSYYAYPKWWQAIVPKK
jgi:hypothetical protein